MRSGKGTIRDIELLGAEEVAGLVGVKESTVWRWCRQGRLPCLKVGKHWRIRRGVLEDFLKESERTTTLLRRMESFLQVPDSVLAIAADGDVLRRIDAAFFRVGEARDGLLVKFYGGESVSEGELRATLEGNGFEAGRLQGEGRLLMRAEGDPLEGRGERLGRVLGEASSEGRTVWASFDWALEVDLETALGQQERLNGLVDSRRLVVKTATVDATIDGWPASALRRALASHSGTILASGDGLSLSRATPMPAL